MNLTSKRAPGALTPDAQDRNLSERHDPWESVSAPYPTVRTTRPRVAKGSVGRITGDSSATVTRSWSPGLTVSVKAHAHRLTARGRSGHTVCVASTMAQRGSVPTCILNNSRSGNSGSMTSGRWLTGRVADRMSAGRGSARPGRATGSISLERVRMWSPSRRWSVRWIQTSQLIISVRTRHAAIRAISMSALRLRTRVATSCATGFGGLLLGGESLA